MKALGLDIGTTNISAVVYSGEQEVLTAKTVANDSFLPGMAWERLQDPSKIWSICQDLLADIMALYPEICAVGVTGQMHGILYLDKDGNPVSPLYTWQDGRGDLPCCDGRSWAQQLAQLTGYHLSSGYGIVTHYYNLCNGLLPQNTGVFCTIADFIAMKLAGRNAPMIDSTNAASLGLYDLQRGSFDQEVMIDTGIDPILLPKMATTPFLGCGFWGIPVFTAIGDNQASFLGAVDGKMDAVLINMGTGGQVCVYSPEYMQADTLETRPFPDGGWLLVGASLCGGRSYALLERFFRETVRMVTGQEISAYDAMTRALETDSPLADTPRTVTTFQGTRKAPSQRGSITGITADNFTPVHLLHSVLQGMADELYCYFQGYLRQGGNSPSLLVGSGNGLRKNTALQRTFSNTFGCPLILSKNQEEAACGAAIYALQSNK